MAQPVPEGGERTPRRASSDPTMLKALLRERHWQNYGMFKRAYQKAARGLDKDLVETYPSVSTFRRWLAGQVQDLPYPDHCAVLEAMLPGWTVAELFKPYVAPENVDDSTLLRELLRRRCLHNYREFCRAYDVAATAIDSKLVGSYPAQQQFHRWICGELAGLPHPEQCNVLEALFPGYSARQLFGIADPAEPAAPENPDQAVKGRVSEPSGDSALIVPDEASASAGPSGTDVLLMDDFAGALVKHLEPLVSSLLKSPERSLAYDELVQFLGRWAYTMERRLVLRLLGRAASAAAVAGLLGPDELERIGSVLSRPARIDAQTIENFDKILQNCKRLDDALGPRGVLDTVLVQRGLLQSLLPDCPAGLRPQLLSVLSIASGHAGWFSFNLNDASGAASYYEDARVLAHEAENVELGANALGYMSSLATSRGKPRIGIDHAAAAQHWVNRSGDVRLRALCADDAAQAYAADGQRDACMAALDTAATALGRIGDQPAGYVLYIEEVHLAKRARCHLALGDAGRAADHAQRALETLDPAFPRRVALTIVDLARARARSGEVNESVRLLGEAADIAARNSSTRLITRLQQGRAELQSWQHTTAVRELDDRLVSCGLA